MRKRLISLTTLAAVLLAGCTMIPKYTRPDAPVPGGWPSGPAYKATAEAAGETPLAADLHWREYFTDPRLQKIIETALEGNRNLRVAALNVEKARALYRIQRAELLPRVDASAYGARERTPGDLTSSGKASTGSQYSASLGVTAWEIDFFGRIRSMEERALQEFFATEQARRSAQILLISEVAGAYLALAADRENLELAKSTLEAQQASHHLIRRRSEVGLATELEVRQVQTRVDASRVDVAKFTEQIAFDENALNLLAGSPVPAELLPESLSSLAPLPDLSPGTTSEVLLRRPDILQAENLLKASNADIGTARAAFFPRVSLTSALGTASSDLTGLFKPGSFAWNFAPQLALPLFDARLWPALKASKVEREITLTQYEKAIQTAFREVADALAGRGTLGDRMEAQQSLVDASAEAYRLSGLRYLRGSDIYLVVLDAQRSLYAAQQGLITIRLALLANQVRLYAVLGGGGDPPPTSR